MMRCLEPVQQQMSTNILLNFQHSHHNANHAIWCFLLSFYHYNNLIYIFIIFFSLPWLYNTKKIIDDNQLAICPYLCSMPRQPHSMGHGLNFISNFIWRFRTSWHLKLLLSSDDLPCHQYPLCCNPILHYHFLWQSRISHFSTHWTCLGTWAADRTCQKNSLWAWGVPSCLLCTSWPSSNHGLYWCSWRKWTHAWRTTCNFSLHLHYWTFRSSCWRVLPTC